MCGIVGAVSTRNIVPVLIEGLKRLEYRGYDSAAWPCTRAANCAARAAPRAWPSSRPARSDGIVAGTGIAHTRWATHGAPAVHNAHPHFSAGPGVDAESTGFGSLDGADEARPPRASAWCTTASSRTTTSCAPSCSSAATTSPARPTPRSSPTWCTTCTTATCSTPCSAPCRACAAPTPSPCSAATSRTAWSARAKARRWCWAWARARTSWPATPWRWPASPTRSSTWKKATWSTCSWARCGSARATPRAASAQPSTAPCAPCRRTAARPSWAPTGTTCRRRSSSSRAPSPTRWTAWAGISPELFGDGAYKVFKDIDRVLILACGTSYYSGSTARYWLESIAGIPTTVEIASEYRYRDSVPDPRTLVVTISQSGETADTIAALKHARSLGMPHTLTICNVGTSAMVRECALNYITRAGVEIGVASTKAFTTQLVGLYLLTLALARCAAAERRAGSRHLKALRHLPVAVQAVLALEPQVIAWSEDFAARERAVPGPRAALPDRAGRRAQAQGDQLHPRRGLPGRRAQARPAGAGDRPDAGGDRGAERRAAGKAQEQHAGSARARRPAVRVCRHRHAHRQRAPACT
jgi:glucosamine--fructose-6-phosphate aminotransferase (isomerizing)